MPSEAPAGAGGDDVAVDYALPVGAQPSLAAIVEMGERAEALGFDRIWVPETWGRDAVTVLAILAERTDTIGLANTVFPVSSRSPAVIGQTATTLQEASDGRYRVGLGTSSPIVVENWHGMAFEPALRRLREYVEIVDAVTSGEVVEYDGEVFDLTGFRLRCAPDVAPPPIDAATIGPKAVELTGRFADGWQATAFTPEGFENRLDHLARGADLGGRSPGDLRIMLSKTCCVLEDGDRARHLAADHVATYLGGMGPYYREALSRAGYEDLASEIASAWADDDRDRARALVADTLLDHAVVGTPEVAAPRLAALRERDLDAVSLVPPRGITVEESRESMTNVGELLEDG